MVTGVETAGLILAAFPLIISALEHYENAIDPARAFVKWQGELSKAVRDLYMGLTLYNLTVSLLLKPIASKQDLDEMMEDPKSNLWKDETLADKLRLMLGRTYGACMLTIQEIEEIMASIAECLNIEGAHKVTQQGLEAIILANPPVSNTSILCKKFEFRKRVKFSIKRRTVRNLLEKLDKCNSRLQNYTERAEQLEEEPYKAHIKLQFTAPLTCIQENATKLHQVLSRSWCKSHPSHRAGLLLEQRLVRQKIHLKEMGGASEAVARANCFGLSLSPSAPEFRWLDTEFRLLEKTTSSKSIRVIITLPEEESRESTEPPHKDASQLQEIKNICSIMQEDTHSCVGFYFDEMGILRGGHPTPRRACSYVDRMVTLGDLLPKVQGRLAIGELYTLAITLTASLLQLSHTPWLQALWCKRDIAFLRANHRSYTSVDIQHPYLIQTYSLTMSARENRGHSRANDSSNLLALAIMLLEINFARSIESLHCDEDLGPNSEATELSNLSAARRWLMEQTSQGNVSRAFSNAITYCLQSYMNPQASFRDQNFCRAMEEQVLMPLEEEMQLLLPGTTWISNSE